MPRGAAPIMEAAPAGAAPTMIPMMRAAAVPSPIASTAAATSGSGVGGASAATTPSEVEWGGQRSAPGSHVFANESGEAVQLSWGDEHGRDTHHGELLPRRRVVVGTYSFHTWRVRSASRGLIAEYTGASALVVINPGGYRVEPQAQHRRSAALLAPPSPSASSPSAPSPPPSPSPLPTGNGNSGAGDSGARAAGGGGGGGRASSSGSGSGARSGRRTTAAAAAGPSEAEVEWGGRRSAPGSHVFANESGEAVQLSWGDGHGRDTHHGEVLPRRRVVVGTYSFHTWRVRSASRGLIAEYTGPSALITINPDGYRTEPNPRDAPSPQSQPSPSPSPSPRDTRRQSRRSRPSSQTKTNAQPQPQPQPPAAPAAPAAAPAPAATAAAIPEAAVPLPPAAAAAAAKGASSASAVQMTAAAAAGVAVVAAGAPAPAAAPLRAAAAVGATLSKEVCVMEWNGQVSASSFHLFVNSTAEPLEVSWGDTAGNEEPYGAVAPSANLFVGTYSFHTWRVRSASRGLIAEYTGPSAVITVTPDGYTAHQNSNGHNGIANGHVTGHSRPDDAGAACAGAVSGSAAAAAGGSTSAPSGGAVVYGGGGGGTAAAVGPAAGDAGTAAGGYRQRSSVLGMPIWAFDCVSDAAVRRLESVVSYMLATSPPQLLERLREGGASFAIFGREQVVTDVPAHAFMRYNTGRDLDASARGLGATPCLPVTSCGEENLTMEGDRWYPCQSILVHEVGHMVHNMGLPAPGRAGGGGRGESGDVTGVSGGCCDGADSGGTGGGTGGDGAGSGSCSGGGGGGGAGLPLPGVEDVLEAYQAAMESRLYPEGCYMATNEQEYWAVAVESWFESSIRRDVNGGVRTRDALRRHDPRLAGLLEATFGDGPWRYWHDCPAPLSMPSPRRHHEGSAASASSSGAVAAAAAAAAAATAMEVPPPAAAAAATPPPPVRQRSSSLARAVTSAAAAATTAAFASMAAAAAGGGSPAAAVVSGSGGSSMSPGGGGGGGGGGSSASWRSRRPARLRIQESESGSDDDFLIMPLDPVSVACLRCIDRSESGFKSGCGASEACYAAARGRPCGASLLRSLLPLPPPPLPPPPWSDSCSAAAAAGGAPQLAPPLGMSACRTSSAGVGPCSGGDGGGWCPWCCSSTWGGGGGALMPYQPPYHSHLLSRPRPPLFQGYPGCCSCSCCCGSHSCGSCCAACCGGGGGSGPPPRRSSDGRGSFGGGGAGGSETGGCSAWTWLLGDPCGGGGGSGGSVSGCFCWQPSLSGWCWGGGGGGVPGRGRSWRGKRALE